MMNNCTFAGNIGKDCRVNSVNGSNGQTTVVNFTLAVDKKRKDQNGEKQTLWVDCAVWGKRAEALQQYLTKGQKVCVSGFVDVDIFTKDDGQSIPKLNLMVNDITLQGSRNQQGGNQPPQQSQAPQQQQQQRPAQNQGQQQQPQGGALDFDDDIPFSPLFKQYRGMHYAV